MRARRWSRLFDYLLRFSSNSLIASYREKSESIRLFVASYNPSYDSCIRINGRRIPRLLRKKRIISPGLVTCNCQDLKKVGTLGCINTSEKASGIGLWAFDKSSLELVVVVV